MVVHSDLIVKKFSTISVTTSPVYDHLSGIGVELFFIVSGYIMCMRAPAFRTWHEFIIFRIARIYPLYMFFTTIAIMVGLVVPAWRLGQFVPDIATFARSYLALPGWGFPILGVGWTLEYEMTFYMLVTAAIGLRLAQGRWTVPVAWVLGGLAAIGCVRGPATSGSALLFHILSPYMFAFGAGWLFRSLEQATWPQRIGNAAPFVALVLSALWLGTAWGSNLILRIAITAAVFLVFIAARRVFQVDNRINRWFWLLGDASYSLYLSHWFVLSALGKILGVVTPPAGLEWLVRIAGFAVAISVGVAIFRYLEKPVDRRLRSGIRLFLTLRRAQSPVLQ